MMSSEEKRREEKRREKRRERNMIEFSQLPTPFFPSPSPSPSLSSPLLSFNSGIPQKDMLKAFPQTTYPFGDHRRATILIPYYHGREKVVALRQGLLPSYAMLSLILSFLSFLLLLFRRPFRVSLLSKRRGEERR